MDIDSRIIILTDTQIALIFANEYLLAKVPFESYEVFEDRVKFYPAESAPTEVMIKKIYEYNV